MDKWRILAVDDDPDLLTLISETLGDAYEILTLDKSTEFDNVLRLFEPDLVILDILMPKVNGYQLIEFMKNNKRYAATPVIFLSAKATHQDLKTGYSKGANLYLTKPFQPSRLRKNVDLIFEQTPPRQTKKTLALSEVKARLEYQSTTDLTGARHDSKVGNPDAEFEPNPGLAPSPQPELNEEEDDAPKTNWLG